MTGALGGLKDHQSNVLHFSADVLHFPANILHLLTNVLHLLSNVRQIPFELLELDVSDIKPRINHFELGILVLVGALHDFQRVGKLCCRVAATSR